MKEHLNKDVFIRSKLNKDLFTMRELNKDLFIRRELNKDYYEQKIQDYDPKQEDSPGKNFKPNINQESKIDFGEDKD